MALYSTYFAVWVWSLSNEFTMPEYHDIDLSERLYFFNLLYYGDRIMEPDFDDGGEFFPKDLVYLSKEVV